MNIKAVEGRLETKPEPVSVDRLQRSERRLLESLTQRERQNEHARTHEQKGKDLEEIRREKDVGR